MKSPVPVVMSNIGRSMPSGSMDLTPRRASLLIAVPSIVLFLVIAGSTEWKNLRISRSPPSRRTQVSPLLLAVRSIRGANANLRRYDVTRSTISGSVLAMRRVPEKLPSASKMPARNPLHQASEGRPGHATISRTAATPTREEVRIASIARLPAAASAKTNPWVCTSSSSR
jgi:hypothetical protein